MSFSKKIKISICVSMIVAIIFSICSFAKTSEQIRSDVLRLHVIANSDSSVDQNLKIRLRDFLLEEGKSIFDGSVNVENAVKKIEPQIPALEKSAKEFIRASGFDYDVKISLSREYFTTRTYETVTLPAGKYLALRVVIGSGEGHNWWCIVFPSVCLSACSSTLSEYLTEDEMELVQSGYTPKFKIIEIVEKIKDSID